MTKRSLLGVLAASVMGSSLFCLQCGSSGSGTPEADNGGTSSTTPTSGAGNGTAGSSSGTTGGNNSTAGAGNGGAGSSGAGGSGTAGSGPVGAAGTGTVVPGGPSVLQVGGDVYHRATYTQPALVTSTVKAMGMAPDAMFDMNATFPGNGNSSNQGTPSVLYVANGPAAAGCPAGATGCKATARAAGAGMFVAFAALGSSPNAFAFDETTGLPVWTASLPSKGDGIRGTPVIDLTSRRVFAVTAGPHQVHALSLDTGVEVTTGGWPVAITFNGTVDNDQNQHGGAIILNNIMYVPFGGQYGDGGTYKGVVFSVNITDPTMTGSWVSQSPRSGIWGAGGIVSDGQSSVFAVTGDTTSIARNASDSEEVVRLSGLAAFTRSAANVFVPTEWAGWDRPAGDLDFGASTPAYVPLPAGSKPAALLVAPAKAGRLFILDGTNLSNGTYDGNRTPGGALADLVVSGTTGETVYTSPTIYTSASGLHATINVGAGLQTCPGGGLNNEVIVSTLIKPGQTPIASTTGPAWCAKVNAGGGHMNFPPISTTTDGASANPLVWFIDGNQLRAVDGDTGAAVTTTTGAACTGVPSMSFPIAVKNRIVVWALGHLCSWSLVGN